MPKRLTVYARILTGVSLLLASAAKAQTGPIGADGLPWMYEIRAGYLHPELDLFSTFYGDDKKSLVSFAAGYRFRNWFELGAEYGRMRANGVGLLTTSQELGGSVKYDLNPLHIYSNLMLQRSVSQRIVPYVGVGLAAAHYEQTVAGQSKSEGTTDVGYSLRAGLRVLFGSRSRTSQTPWRGYVLVEASDFSAEVGDVDLGGKTYLLGIRMEFAITQR